MTATEPLEAIAERYRKEGYEVFVSPRPDQVPAFLDGSDLSLFAVKNGEYRTVHTLPQSATPTTTTALPQNPLVSSGREPEPSQIRAILWESERILQTGAAEASLMLAWSATEAALRKAVNSPDVAFVRPPVPRELIREVARRNLVSTADLAILERTWNLRNMVAHGLKPGELVLSDIRSLIGIGRKLAGNPDMASLESESEREFGLKSIRYGYDIRQSSELLSLVIYANREFAEVLGTSVSEVSAEWDRTADARGKTIITLRLSDFAGAVTGTFEVEEFENSAAFVNRLYRLWADLLRVRIHKQLEDMKAPVGEDTI